MTKKKIVTEKNRSSSGEAPEVQLSQVILVVVLVVVVVVVVAKTLVARRI